jgi:CHAD domain-containing protein
MLPGVEHGDVRAIHRARVASRRLRELLPVLQLDPDGVRKLARRLRKVTRRLGPVREMDVLLPLLDELHESSPGSHRALARVADSLRAARAEAREGLAAKTAGSTEFRRVVKKLAGAAKALERADTQSNVRAWQWALDARVAHRAIALRAAIDEAGAVYLPERLHAVRVALKKLRYGVELWAEVVGWKRNPDLRRLKRNQDLLGRLHDLQVLIDCLRREQASLMPPDVRISRELDALVVSLENSCRGLHARYVSSRAALAALCDRLANRPTRAEPARRAG